MQIRQSFSSIFSGNTRFVGQLILLLLGSNFLTRLVFFVFHLQGSWEFTWAEALIAFVVGLRFDLATISIFSGVFLLLLALPFPILQKSASKKWITRAMLSVHFLVMFVNLGDVAYFGYASKRTSHELFTGGKDLLNISLLDMLPYFWLVLIWIALFWLQLKITNRWIGRAERRVNMGKMKVWQAWILPLLMLPMLFLAFRGGWQLRPLRPANAFVTSSTFLGNVALNSAYTVVMSLDLGNEAEVELMPKEEAFRLAQDLARNDFDLAFDYPEYPLVRRTNFTEAERPLNVVILILESFNAAKVGAIKGLPIEESKTPNFDLLARKGRLFTNFFSNGSRSIQSLPAILNSIPEIFDRPLIGSSFETNQHWGIGNMLDARGYSTSFICGGPNGTMGFDSYCKVSGIKQYFGWSDFPKDRPAPASNWGIHDHAMLQWLAELQNGFAKPFLNVWFSISNHHPFALPSDCPEEIKQSEGNDMDKTVRYTDWALGEYFRKIENEEWAKNTIFLITGDHCFYFADDPDRGDVQNFHVPLLLLGPDIPVGIDDRASGHLSILPTLIELLRLKTLHASAGVSLFSQQNAPYNVTNLMGLRAIARDSTYVCSDFEVLQNSFKYKNGNWNLDLELGKSAAGTSLVESLKGLYQTSSYVRKHNKLVIPSGME